MTPARDLHPFLTRRGFVKGLGTASLLLPRLRAFGSPLLLAPLTTDPLTLSGTRLVPHYPAQSPLDDLLRLVAPGSDDYITELYACELGELLRSLGEALRQGDFAAVSRVLQSSGSDSPPSATETVLRDSCGIRSVRREFPQAAEAAGAGRLAAELRRWLDQQGRVETAEFEITSLRQLSAQTLRVTAVIHYDVVGSREQTRSERVGSWRTQWLREQAGADKAGWRLVSWLPEPEILSEVHGPGFLDVTESAFRDVASYHAQMLRGTDYWRTVLDGASGIDVYGNNGIAAGDFDNDGFDDLYVSQPAGLPNRLYQNRGDGTFQDVTDNAGVGVLDNTACALFADLRNSGLQDLIVVCGSGPLLFINQGDGTFKRKPDAFEFAQPPQGTFTHAAVADYDRDGRLDVYFCVYSYYLGLDQYHYPAPYYDARNGPPNFLFHNAGEGRFVDRTEQSGLGAENNRYSFACAWGESTRNSFPDLYVVNDFGRNNLYRNRGDGTFVLASTEAHVEDVGAGMSACWADINNDGAPDLYAANMWSSAGQRVSEQDHFHPLATQAIRQVYQQHATGNSLYRNRGDGSFTNESVAARVARGRWAWSSDSWDFDHDGHADLYVANGYISAPANSAKTPDLSSFFWRHVVGSSPEDATPSPAYERGWHALNELIRSDHSWSGFERNVLFANMGDGTFSEISGALQVDLLEDGRAFALADLDHDGRLELIVKNRNAPQLRVLRNAMEDLGDSVAFRLRGTKSNRDAVGAAITLEAGDLRQTKYLQAGTGFLSQHSKEVFFGLGKPGAGGTLPIRATVRWPSGTTQHLQEIPRNYRIALQEGNDAFTATPFSPASRAYQRQAESAPTMSEPESVSTWLLDPLEAPDLTLSDLAGVPHKLRANRGRPAILLFFSEMSLTSIEQVKALAADYATLQKASADLLAIHVGNLPEQIAGGTRLPLPLLSATSEAAGIYNLIYRFLYDRRRDLGFPTLFLLDGQSRIVKLYQGRVEPREIVADLAILPGTKQARIQKALPFKGVTVEATFERNDFTYGVAMFQHGYLEQAAESFKQVVARKPGDAEAFYNLGTLYARRNDLTHATEYLKRTLELRPNYPEAWNNLGMIAGQQGQFEQAVENFEKAIELRPSYATALLNLGNVYRRRGDNAKAQDSLSRALKLEPDNPEANYSIGMYYAQQGQAESAFTYLRQALQLRPDYPEAQNNLGVLMVRQQDYAGAQDQFEQCIRRDPNFEQSYLNLARLYILRKDKDKARATLESLLRAQPASTGAREGLDALARMP